MWSTCFSFGLVTPSGHQLSFSSGSRSKGGREVSFLDASLPGTPRPRTRFGNGVTSKEALWLLAPNLMGCCPIALIGTAKSDGPPKQVLPKGDSSRRYGLGFLCLFAGQAVSTKWCFPGASRESGPAQAAHDQRRVLPLRHVRWEVEAHHKIPHHPRVTSASYPLGQLWVTVP